MTSDPFDELGIEPTFDLDPSALEATYLRLSRETHPDHAQTAALSASELADRLARAARINDAFRTLTDPWSRARALIERLDPGSFERAKNLDPAFLAEAMELAEEVADRSADRRDRLAARLRDLVDADLAAIGAALASGDAPTAATRLHQSKYHRKALADLDASADDGRSGPRAG